MLRRQSGERGEIRCVAGHRVHAVHRDHAGLPRVTGREELFQVSDVVVAEPHDPRAVTRRDHGTVVDRLVCPAVQEHGAVRGQDRQDGHVDVCDRGEQQDVLAAEQLGRRGLDLFVEPRAAEEPGPAGVRAPLGQVLGHRRDDLFIEVEPQVVAGRPVGEPTVADADPAPDLLVDHGVHHRVLVLQSREIRGGGHPAVEPAVRLSSPGRAVQGRPDGNVGLPSSGARISPARAGFGLGGRDGHELVPSA